ncbi:glyoxylate reductase/hydroxypyruvate reductase-like isoform X1 [Styela clava]
MSSTVFRILVTRRIPREAIDILATKCNIDVWDSDECIPNQTLHKRIEGIDGLFCLLTDKIGSATLDAAGPSLKVVSTMSVGVDHIDLRECARRNINIGYTPDVLTAATAEFTLALLLATSRRIVEATREAQSGGWGTWKPTWLCGPSLLGGTVGIVGLGRIGIATLERLRPFGPKKFLYNNTKRRSIEEENELSVEYATLDDLLKRSDFVLCLCALTPESTNLFNREAFNKMKRTAIFINTARGGIVDQDALYEALSSNKIAAAGIDVTNPEPLPVDNALFKLNNCVITPHIASASLQTRTKMATLAAENLLCGLEGIEMPAKYSIS